MDDSFTRDNAGVQPGTKPVLTAQRTHGGDTTTDVDVCANRLIVGGVFVDLDTPIDELLQPLFFVVRIVDLHNAVTLNRLVNQL